MIVSHSTRTTFLQNSEYNQLSSITFKTSGDLLQWSNEENEEKLF